ncbi:MAG TPA: hypothetical protein VNG93_01375 [Candidatus Dormibacteraeota bacterium]|nr:hypothetical protein [Candidatus Dormibacteraeota bacterium]
MATKTRPCDERTRTGRLRKANEFYDAAQLIRRYATSDEELANAFVTLCIHAGIAAADVICCRALSKHAQGEDHKEAVGLLRSATPLTTLANDLDVLLGMKTRAGYGAESVTADDRKKAYRRATNLIERARLV